MPSLNLPKWRELETTDSLRPKPRTGTETWEAMTRRHTMTTKRTSSKFTENWITTKRKWSLKSSQKCCPWTKWWWRKTTTKTKKWVKWSRKVNPRKRRVVSSPDSETWWASVAEPSLDNLSRFQRAQWCLLAALYHRSKAFLSSAAVSHKKQSQRLCEWMTNSRINFSKERKRAKMPRIRKSEYKFEIRWQDKCYNNKLLQ